MRNSQVITETVSVKEEDVRLDRWLKRRLPVTQGQIEKLLRSGQVRVDGARAKANMRLEAGMSVRMPPLHDPDTPGAKPSKANNVSDRDAQFIRDLVIYQDDDMIALNKPAGIAVQGGTKMGDRHLDAMLPALSDGEFRPRLVHRLDKDTSGVLLLARNPASAARLGEMFKSRDMEKVYWAVTVKVPHPLNGQIRCWMAKGTGSSDEAKRGIHPDKERMYRSAQGVEGARHSITDYAVISTAGQQAAWVALRPHTGRTHQLRFHMAELDTQIMGDNKYTTRRERPSGVASGLHLHARSLIVARPHGRPITITAELCGHMQETFATLGFLQSEAGTDPLAPFQ